MTHSLQSQQTVFLDTSIQIRRTLAEPEQLLPLEVQFAAPAINAVTSSYVWMEFQRSVIADYAYVHSLMNRYANWGALFRHILDGQRSFRPRSAVRCTQILGNVYEESLQDIKMASDILHAQITHGLRRQFWTNVTRLHDPIRCDLVVAGVTLQPDSGFRVADSCHKQTAACSLPNFLHENQTKLRAIAEYLNAHPRAIKQQERVERLLTDLLVDPRAALGQSACWPLGDVIIALQVPSEALVWTVDSDFAALTSALGLRLYSHSAKGDE